MPAERAPIPPGPAENYSTSENLLRWMADQFARFGDVFKASIYGTCVYASRDPQHAQHVLRENCQNYVKGRAIKRIAFLLGNGLMVSEGEFWKIQRRMIQPAFHRRAIDALTQTFTLPNVALLEKWQAAARNGAGVNVTRDVSGLVLEVLLKSVFGADYDRVALHFNILSEESVRNLEFAQGFRSLAKIVLQLAAQRRKEKTTSTDILGMLMAAREPKSGKAMSDRQMVSEIKTLIVAGHETTASTLSWIWYLLSQHPEAEKKLSRELNILPGGNSPNLDDLVKSSYTRQIIDEATRLYPAGWLLTRKALKDDQLGDYFVPAGTEIYISPYFIQRHPDLWKDADLFDPDRFGADSSKDRPRLAMLPFSSGPRNCIGEIFARVEMQIHLITIAKQLRLRFVESNPPELDVGVNLRSKHDFIMYPELKAGFESPRTIQRLAR